MSAELGEDALDIALNVGCANVFYLPVVTKIDLFGRAYEPFDDSEFSRRRSVVVRSGASLIIKSPQDTVLRKLLWYREGGETSDKQWRDVVSVLRIGGVTLDRTYLQTWAKRLGISDLLERAES
jgi:hypothetical protein